MQITRTIAKGLLKNDPRAFDGLRDRGGTEDPVSFSYYGAMYHNLSKLLDDISLMEKYESSRRYAYIAKGEHLLAAIKRELKEELGAEVEVICKIGVVSDDYHLIHRHNLNHYYLCKVQSFGDKNLTQDEIEDFHLSTRKLSYEDAISEYEKCRETKLGRLIANRELPILKKAHELIGTLA